MASTPKTEDGGVRDLKTGQYAKGSTEKSNPSGTVHETNRVGKKADPSGPEKTRSGATGQYTKPGKESSDPSHHQHEHDPKPSGGKQK